MAKRPTLLQHFRSFAYQNSIKDLDTALKYFVVFGGTGWEVDVSQSVETLIEEKVLRHYAFLHKSMTRYTHNNPVYHHLLSIIASGIEHELDAFKKARVGRDRGEEAIDYLVHKSLLKFDLSIEMPADSKDEKSDRVLFELPFMRFWFAMVSPYYKGIATGDFGEFAQQWHKVRNHFSVLLSNLLVRELVKQTVTKKCADDPIVSIGSYYDKQVELEVLALRKSGKMLAASCKYSKEPAKENMLRTLKEKCQKAELNIGEYMLFSKNGFTDEVVQSREEGVTLLSQLHLSALLDNVSQDDLLVYKNRKY